MTSYLNVGCGTHYAKGWVNTDVWSDDTTCPDVVVAPGDPYPFDDNSFDAIYMGHVLEHIAWDKLYPFLVDIRRVAKPGAPILAVGPDVYRTIQRWAQNQEPWSMIESVMEHQDREGGYLALSSGEPTTVHWAGICHYWNCHERRLAEAMSWVFTDVKAMSNVITFDTSRKSWFDSAHSIEWPVVGYWPWQCAVIGYAPS